MRVRLSLFDVALEIGQRLIDADAVVEDAKARMHSPSKSLAS